MGPSVLSGALLDGRGRNPNQAAKSRNSATAPQSSQCLFRPFIVCLSILRNDRTLNKRISMRLMKTCAFMRGPVKDKPRTSLSMSDIAARPSWVRKAITLEYFSIVWMVAEGTVSVWAGISAHSLSLEVFGLDSLIEMISAGVVLWWLQVEKAELSSERAEQAERRAAYVVAGCLLALAFYIVAGVIQSLASREVPRPGPLGFAVSIAAIIVMPLLWRRKRQLGEFLESAALEEDGVGNLACGWMALILLVSLLLQRQGLWWADPLASVALGIFIAREGLEAWQRARG